jgi:NhaP-type Na+/H+ or K+/H+ antiporter
MDLTFYLLLMLTFGFTCAYLAERKGRPYRSWLVLGALLGFVALLIILAQPSARAQADDA